MLKKSLGASAFFGRGAPQSFMTDNCDPERKALAATWPSAQLFLCIFHLLQQVWRLLLDSKHGIPKQNRQELMASAKALVYAGSVAEFEKLWDGFQDNPLAIKHSKFVRYYHGSTIPILLSCKKIWIQLFKFVFVADIFHIMPSITHIPVL